MLELRSEMEGKKEETEILPILPHRPSQEEACFQVPQEEGKGKEMVACLIFLSLSEL